MALHGISLGAPPGSRRQAFEITRSQMKVERGSFEAHWRDLGDHINPRRTRFIVQDGNRGDRRTRKIIDGTATLAVRNLSAGMMGGITSPARDWFRLAVPDRELNDLPDVKAWLDEVTRLIFTMFGRSNLYEKLPITYRDMATFGTAAMFVEEDFETTLRFRSLPLGSFWIALDEKDRVRVFIREFRMTVRQVVEKFGDLDEKGEPKTFENFSDHVRTAWESGQKESWVEIVHLVQPNDQFDPDKLESKFKKFLSVYYESGVRRDGSALFTASDDDTFLLEQGFDFFPVLAPRWETAGEDVYGTDCPGMTALGDIRQLQHGEKKSAQAIDKIINPPMKGPYHLKKTKVSILPGAMVYTEDREGMRGFTPTHEVDPRVLDLENKQDQVRRRIKSFFYEDLFLMLANTDRREITAREVEEKHEEKLLALGGVLERLNEDLLNPLIDLAFDLMNKQGLLPEPPEEMQGLDLKVEYISIMAQAQKLAGLGALERMMRFMVEVAAVDPSVMDKLDLDELIDVYADTVGIPAKIIRSTAEAQAIRQQRQQVQAQAEQVAMVKDGAAAVKDLGKTKLDEDNLMARLLQQAQANAGPTAEQAAA